MNDKEIIKNAEDFFGGDKLAAQVWFSKYRLDGETSPKDMGVRCAETLWVHLNPRLQKIMKSQVLDDYDTIKSRIGSFTKQDFIDLFTSFTIIPGGSLLAGLGTDAAVSLSNCFVLSSPEDNYPSIMMKQLDLVECMKRRGGCGVDLSKIRPNGAAVNNSAKSSTGVKTVMDQYSMTTTCVAQGGRRGALMISLSIKHPDIMDFIKIKRDHTKVTGANISLMMDDPTFMKKVIAYKSGKDSDYLTRFPIDLSISGLKLSDFEYDVLTPVKGGYVKKYKISEIWDEFIESNWSSADPGIIFKDHQDTFSPSHPYKGYENVCTNPCSEIMMGGEDSCRLLAINLARFVRDPFTKNAWFDEDSYRFITFIASLVGDCIVDEECNHLERIINKVSHDDLGHNEKMEVLGLWVKLKDNGLKGRRVGLGMTGLGDVYAYLNSSYGDPDINKFILDSKSSMEWLASIALSDVYEPFIGWDPKIDEENAFFQQLCEINEEFKDFIFPLMLKYGRRNISISTCAPNGSTSILTQTTSGIEPVFLSEYERKRKVTENEEYDIIDEVGCKFKIYKIYHPGLAKWMALPESERALSTNPYKGNEAQDLDYVKRVMNQAQIQSYISHSISSTVNLPEDVSKDVLSDIYIMAWKNKLKGITVYRDGSKMGILTSSTAKEPEMPARFERPEVLPCSIIRMKFKASDSNDQEEWMAFLSTYNGKPVEIFTGRSTAAFKLDRDVKEGEVIKVILDAEKEIHRYDFRYIDKDGYRVTVEGLNRCFNSEYYNYSKLVSSMLKSNFYTIDHVVNILHRLNLGDSINGWKSGVIRALQKFIKNGTKVNKAKCPECGNDLIYIEGCVKCSNPECSWTKCGI